MALQSVTQLLQFTNQLQRATLINSNPKMCDTNINKYKSMNELIHLLRSTQGGEKLVVMLDQLLLVFT